MQTLSACLLVAVGSLFAVIGAHALNALPAVHCATEFTGQHIAASAFLFGGVFAYLPASLIIK